MKKFRTFLNDSGNQNNEQADDHQWDEKYGEEDASYVAKHKLRPINNEIYALGSQHLCEV